MRITFHNQSKPSLTGRRILKAYIPMIFATEKTRFESVDIIFCSDDDLLEINRRYLNHDYYTDIITFDLAENGSPVVGELYISTDRVKENSFSNHASSEAETLRVIFHGLLHLCGYGDKTRLQKRQMTNKENHFLEEYALFHKSQFPEGT